MSSITENRAKTVGIVAYLGILAVVFSATLVYLVLASALQGVNASDDLVVLVENIPAVFAQLGSMDAFALLGLIGEALRWALPLSLAAYVLIKVRRCRSQF